MMFAQMVTGGYSLVHLLVIGIIVIAAVCIFLVITKAMGWTPPEWAAKVFWIVLAAIVGITALHILVSMAW